MNISHLTPAKLRQAAEIIERIEELQNQLNEIQGGKADRAVKAVVPVAIEANGKPARKRRKMSATGLARIRAAQKARWARVHAAQGR